MLNSPCELMFNETLTDYGAMALSTRGRWIITKTSRN